MNLLVTPVVAAVVGFGVWFIQSRIDAMRRAREALRDERRKAYADILDPFIRLFAGINNEQETRKAIKHVASFEYKRAAFEFALVGADDVVKSFNNLMQKLYRADAEGSNISPRDFLFLWGVFLLEIRRSLGDEKTKLTPIDMLSSQIKDIDALVGKK